MELALGWFNADEEHIPFDVFTGCRRASAREGLVADVSVASGHSVFLTLNFFEAACAGGMSSNWSGSGG